MRNTFSKGNKLIFLNCWGLYSQKAVESQFWFFLLIQKKSLVSTLMDTNKKFHSKKTTETEHTVLELEYLTNGQTTFWNDKLHIKKKEFYVKSVFLKVYNLQFFEPEIDKAEFFSSQKIPSPSPSRYVLSISKFKWEGITQIIGIGFLCTRRGGGIRWFRISNDIFNPIPISFQNPNFACKISRIDLM